MRHNTLTILRLSAALLAFFALYGIGVGTLMAGTATPDSAQTFTIDSITNSVAGISVGMSESDVRNAGWPYEVRSVSMEGDEYTVYEIALPGDMTLTVIFSFITNRVGRIQSYSPGIHDENGLGVGSELSKLKRIYPKGRFYHGAVEGRVVSFSTNSGIVFFFDPDGLEESCFSFDSDARASCAPDPSIKVKMLSISGH